MAPGRASRQSRSANSGFQHCAPGFVRSLVGLDRASATEAFSRFLADTTYTAPQFHFVGLIVQHLTTFDRASGEQKDDDVLPALHAVAATAENVTQGREDQPQPNSQAIRSRATYGPRRLRSRRQPLVGIAIDCSPGDIEGPTMPTPRPQAAG